MDIKQVIVADDDGDMRDLLRNCMEGLGLQVRLAEDALSALMEVRRQRPDLLILDVNMPGGNGLSACEMLQSDAAAAGLPVIILTGRADDPTLRRCQTMGAHYVRKGADALERVVFVARRLLWPGTEVSDAHASLYLG